MSQLKLRITQLTAALARLDEVLAQPKNAFMRDSAIQRFEFTSDLAWKALQGVLAERFGLIANSPKTAARMAHENGLVSDLPLWLAMVDDRNLTSHSYDEEIAEKIYAQLPRYADMVRQLLRMITADTTEHL